MYAHWSQKEGQGGLYSGELQVGVFWVPHPDSNLQDGIRWFGDHNWGVWNHKPNRTAYTVQVIKPTW